MPKIKVGIIGLGVGLKHYEAYKHSNLSQVKAISDYDKKKFEKIKKENRNIKYFHNSKDLINNKDIDLVSIASYDDDHYNQILECIKNKKNIFVEKPICLKQSQLQRIKKLIKKKDIKIESNFVLRHTGIFKNLKKIIKKEKKTLYHIEADYLWGRYRKLFGWRSKAKNYSLILGGAIHMIDLVCWLLEDLPIKVYTVGNKIALKNERFKKENFILMLLEFRNKLTVKISVNSCSQSKHFHDVRIFTKNKSIYHSPLESVIFKNQSQKKLLGLYPDKENRKNQIINFLKKLNNKKNKQLYDVNLFNVMQICFEGIKSLKLKKAIDIKYAKN